MDADQVLGWQGKACEVCKLAVLRSICLESYKRKNSIIVVIIIAISEHCWNSLKLFYIGSHFIKENFLKLAWIYR